MTNIATALLALAWSQASPQEVSPGVSAPTSQSKEAPARPAPEAQGQVVRGQLPEPVQKPVASNLLVEPGAPALRWNVPARCLERPSAAWRAQCDSPGRRCVAAPDAELGPGGEPRGPLERAPACEQPALKESDLLRQGWTIVPGLAETPPGWRRDERQRVMQVNFDLNRRLWLGGGWALGSAPWAGTGQVGAGLRVDTPFEWGNARALARFRLAEGWSATDGTAAEIVAATVDASRAYPSPLLRITTFIGKPRRFDPPLYFGLWGEAARFETLETRSGRRFSRSEALAAAFTLDLWRSADLESFVRFRGGGGYETASGWAGGESWVPLGAIEADLTLDQGGFHHLRALGQYEAVLGTKTPEILAGSSTAPLARDRERWTARAEYEVIILAVNDQPLSLVLDLRAQKRDDVPDFPTGWLTQGVASLRFSLWVPSRRMAPAQERL